MKRVAALGLAALLCLGAAKADPRAAKFLESMQLEPDAKVQYHDEKGRVLAFDAFFALVMKGRSFGYDHEGRVGADFRLDPVKPSAAKKEADPAKREVVAALKAGDAFPAFSLPGTKGARVTAAALRGKLTLVNFFFADCVPCIAEIPALNAYARHHPEVQVLAVTFDDLAIAKRFAKQRGLQWPIVAEAQGLIDSAGVSGFPTFALVGPDGRVRAITHSAAIPPKGAKLDVGNLSSWVARNRRAAKAK